MPFYIRAPVPRPLWQPAAAGASVMLVWALAQAILRATSSHGSHSSVLWQGLVILMLTVSGGAVAGGLGLVLGLTLLRRSLPLRWAAGAAATMMYLIALALAASQAEPGGPWGRVTRPSFLLSTFLLSLAIGWIVARDPFNLARRAERVYLTPGEYAALTPSAQGRLRPESEPGAPGNDEHAS